MPKVIVRTTIPFLLFLLPLYSISQKTLQPGFNPGEYADLLQLNFVAIGDTLPMQHEYVLGNGIYKKIFRSPEVGLYNRCELFTRDGNTVVISLRGTIAKSGSWLENFYMAMVPANGSLQLNDSSRFDYRLASDSGAFVHTGWLLGLASLSAYIDKNLGPLLAQGITDIIVMGHSQGGVLAFLTTSYLWYKYHEKFPSMRLKTYASAAPKPGNLNYAYDFDFITRNGFGFRIVNQADWVPESPVSIQTVQDFNSVNPITDAKTTLRKQKFLSRIALVHVYNKLDRKTYKSMKNFRKYMGGAVGKQVNKTLPEFVAPEYAYSMNYMTAGSPVILKADNAYYDQFKFDGKNIFIHHLIKPYLYLLQQHYPYK
ncbi:MAG: lipase family protein [Bacteroidota bacterium]